jgi:hypothetical protein
MKIKQRLFYRNFMDLSIRHRKEIRIIVLKQVFFTANSEPKSTVQQLKPVFTNFDNHKSLTLSVHH